MRAFRAPACDQAIDVELTPGGTRQVVQRQHLVLLIGELGGNRVEIVLGGGKLPKERGLPRQLGLDADTVDADEPEPKTTLDARNRDHELRLRARAVGWPDEDGPGRAPDAEAARLLQPCCRNRLEPAPG